MTSCLYLVGTIFGSTSSTLPLDEQAASARPNSSSKHHLAVIVPIGCLPWIDARRGLSAVPAGGPAAAGEIALAGRNADRLERGRHRIVPAVEIAEQRDDAENFHDFIVGPMLLQRGGDLKCDRVRNACRGQGKIEGGFLGRGKQRARRVVPDRRHALRRRAEAFGRENRMRLAIAASGRLRGDEADQPL